jgi:hypothetical protein
MRSVYAPTATSDFSARVGVAGDVLGDGVDVAADDVGGLVEGGELGDAVARSVIHPDRVRGVELLEERVSGAHALGHLGRPFLGVGKVQVGVGRFRAEAAPDRVGQLLRFGEVAVVEEGAHPGLVGPERFGKGGVGEGLDLLLLSLGLVAPEPEEGAVPAVPEGLVGHLPHEQRGVLAEVGGEVAERGPAFFRGFAEVDGVAGVDPGEKPVRLQAVQGGRVGRRVNEIEARIARLLQDGVVLGVFVEAKDERALAVHDKHAVVADGHVGGPGRKRRAADCRTNRYCSHNPYSFRACTGLIIGQPRSSGKMGR